MSKGKRILFFVVIGISLLAFVLTTWVWLLDGTSFLRPAIQLFVLVAVIIGYRRQAGYM